MAMSIAGGGDTNPLSPDSNNVQPEKAGVLNGTDVREVTPHVQVGESVRLSVSATTDSVDDVAITQRSTELSAEEKPKSASDLKGYYEQYFFNEENGAYKLVHYLDDLLHPSASQPGLAHHYCKQLREAALLEKAEDRQAKLQEIEQKITSLLMAPTSPEAAQEFVALAWWCRMLKDELSALEAMHIVPDAKLCQLCDDIIESPLFQCTESKFLQCRATLIRRHAAEHGNTSALTWLIHRCLLSDSGSTGGHTLEEGFRWLHTYQQLIAHQYVPVPDGDSVIVRLVMKGRDFISLRDRRKGSVRERLLAAGLYLDARFGAVDRGAAQKCLEPYCHYKPGNKIPQVSKQDMSIIWFLRGILATPELYKVGSCVPDANGCFQEAVRLGCHDGTLRILQLAIRAGSIGKPNHAYIRSLIEKQLTRAVEDVAPEFWAICYSASWCCNLTSPDVVKARKGSKKNQKTTFLISKEQMEEKLSQGILFAACHGQPEARSRLLINDYVPVYRLAFKRAFPSVRGSFKNLEQARQAKPFQTCCSLLNSLHHVRVDPQLLVYRAVGNQELKVLKACEPEEELDAFLDQAVTLNPLEACGVMEALKIETKKYDVCQQGHLIHTHFCGLLPYQCLHIVNTFRGDYSLAEKLKTSGYVITSEEYSCWYQPLEARTARLHRLLLEKGEVEKAEALWKAATAEEKKNDMWLKFQEIRDGKYTYLHSERVKKYQFNPLPGIGYSSNASGAYLMWERCHGWLKAFPASQGCPQAAWQPVDKIITLLTTYSAFYTQEDIESIVDFFPEAVRRYEACVDRAEHGFALIANDLLTMTDKKADLVKRVKALELDYASRDEDKDQATDCDHLLLPLEGLVGNTQRAFYQMDKSDIGEIIDVFRSLPFKPERFERHSVSKADLPELLYHLVPALKNCQLSKEEMTLLAAKAIVYLEWVIKSSRRAYDSRIGTLFSQLQEIADRYPKCHLMKNKLKVQLRETFITRKERQWDDKCYWGKNEDYRYFINAVDVLGDYRNFANRLCCDLVEDPANFIGELEQVWNLDTEQKSELIKAIEEKSNGKDKRVRKNTKALIKLIRKDFDDDLWKYLTRNPVSSEGNQYPIVMMLLSRQMAYHYKLESQDVVLLFESLVKVNTSPNIYFYWYLWHSLRGEKAGAVSALLQGKAERSPLCELELARRQRKTGNFEATKTLYNALKDDHSGASYGDTYGRSQFEVGEVLLRQTASRAEGVEYEVIFSNWLKASYYHHPLALCRLFTCLYPEPDKKYGLDERLHWVSSSFLAEALESTSLNPTAGKEVCRQLFRYKENLPFDATKLKTACSCLKGAEILILAQLPDSLWPSLNESPTLQEQLKGRAIDCINEHRRQKIVEEPDVIEGVFISSLPYYEEIKEKLESPMVRKMDSSCVVPLKPPATDEVKVHEALTQAFVSKSDATVSSTLHGLYTKYKAGLVDLIKTADYQVRVAKYLLRDGHIDLAMKLLKLGHAGSPCTSELLTQLADSAGWEHDSVKEALMDELTQQDDWTGVTAEKAGLVIQAFMKGAYNKVTLCDSFGVLDKLIENFPSLWKEELSRLKDPAPISQFFPYFSAERKEEWIRSVVMAPEVVSKLNEN